MALADDVRVLQQMTLAALNAGHDYYVDTKRAWRVLQQNVEAGQQLTVVDPHTGETVVDGKLLLRRSQHYVTEYLAPSTFLHFVSLFEHFFFELLRDWLVAFPESLSRKQVDLETVLKAGAVISVVSTVVEKELNDLKYRPLPDWFDYLKSLVKLDCPTEDEVESLGEIKASRDIVIHNNGVANATYVRKAGGRARAAVGEPLVMTEQYHRESWATICKVVHDVATAALGKASQGTDHR